MVEKKAKKKNLENSVQFNMNPEELGGILFTSGFTLSVVVGIGAGFLPSLVL